MGLFIGMALAFFLTVAYWFGLSVGRKEVVAEQQERAALETCGRICGEDAPRVIGRECFCRKREEAP